MNVWVFDIFDLKKKLYIKSLFRADSDSRAVSELSELCLDATWDSMVSKSWKYFRIPLLLNISDCYDGLNVILKCL